MHQVLHKEVQHIRQKFLIILVISSAIIPLLLMIVFLIIQLGYGIPAGNNPMTDTQLIVASILAFIFFISLILLLTKSNLTIEISTDGFHYKYFPFHQSIHNIYPNEVNRWEIKKLKPIADYGGWGIRYGFGKKGKGYIVQGDNGVMFELNNNKKVFFSLIEEEKAKLALEKIFN